MSNSMERIGAGRTAEVFALEDGCALKLFYAGYSTQAVEREAHNAQWVYAQNLPTPRCFGRIHAYGRDGILYEQIRGESLLRRIARTGDADGAMAQMAALHKRVLRCSFPQGDDARSLCAGRSSIGGNPQREKRALCR